MRISTGTRAAFALSLLAMTITAQKTTTDTATTDTGLPNISSTSDSSSASATSTTAKNTDTDSSTGSSTDSSGTASSTGTDSSATVTGTGSSSSLPAVSTTSSEDAGLTGLPTLSGAYSYPVASVPPTSNAPYMQASSYPEGTVFIAVGAILGALAFAVLAWRGLVAWSLHRSVSRAANHPSMADAKSQFRTPAAPFYNYVDGESNMSLANLAGRSKDRKTKVASDAAAQGLFFSPTAGAGKRHQGGNRDSSYLPAGYYAAGASTPGGGNGMMHMGNSGISLSNLGPPMQGYARARSLGTTPPESPNMRPRDDSRLRDESRAPSAYLDDMMDEGTPARDRY